MGDLFFFIGGGGTSECQSNEREQKSAETIVPKKSVERRKEGRVESLEQGINLTSSKR